MKHLLLVFIGGGFGSVLRFLVGKYLNDTVSSFPFGTFAVNSIGSLLIGIILGLAIKNDTLSENYTLLLATGFCGGFTTFSSFAFENHLFLKSGDFISFAVYTSASFLFGLLAVFAGIYLIK